MIHMNDFETQLETWMELNETPWAELVHHIRTIGRIQLPSYVVDFESEEDGGLVEGADYASEVHRYIVLEVTPKTNVTYVRKNGWYQSFAGSSWDGPLHEVKPAVVEVTEWQRV